MEKQIIPMEKEGMEMAEWKIELKPCPFCGAKVDDKDQPIRLGYAYTIDAYCVTCDRCGANGGHHDGRVEAIEAWNKRIDTYSDDDWEPIFRFFRD